jgi:amphi-Trp domain-containing protein
VTHPGKEIAMSSEKTEVSAREDMDLEKAAQFLLDLANSLRKGEVILSHGAESISVKPAKMVRVKTTVKEKKEKTSLSLKISWSKEIQAPLRTLTPQTDETDA